VVAVPAILRRHLALPAWVAVLPEASADGAEKRCLRTAADGSGEVDLEQVVAAHPGGEHAAREGVTVCRVQIDARVLLGADVFRQAGDSESRSGCRHLVDGRDRSAVDRNELAIGLIPAVTTINDALGRQRLDRV